jgi:prepilin signal peptidase PulO-like enzyme (type II secretory pathway)
MTMTHHALLALLWTILGACLGSFLNVCVYRIPRGMSVFRPRSRCPRCGSAILVRHNVPVLGWLVVRGRCRECRYAISPRYPAVELAVGCLFALPYLVAVALSAGDPWERIGSARLLGLLLASWTSTGLGVYVIIAGCDTRWSFGVPTAAGRSRRGAGCEDPASSAPLSRADRS